MKKTEGRKSRDTVPLKAKLGNFTTRILTKRILKKRILTEHTGTYSHKTNTHAAYTVTKLISMKFRSWMSSFMRQIKKKLKDHWMMNFEQNVMKPMI
jgi:hypothetical protein